MSPRRIVTLCEGQPIPRQAFPDHTLPELLRLQATRRHDQTPAIFDFAHGKPRGVGDLVGLVVTRHCDIEILPKCFAAELRRCRSAESVRKLSHQAARLWVKMLQVAAGSRARGLNGASLCEMNGSFSEAMVSSFCGAVMECFRFGVCADYQVVDEKSPVLRGRLLIGASARRQSLERGRPVVRRAAWTRDIPLNRAIKAICRCFQRLPLGRPTRRRVDSILETLAEVGRGVPSQTEIVAIGVESRFRRFAGVLAVCRQVLAGRHPLVSAGRISSFTYVARMHGVFEDFVGAYIRRLPAFSGILFERQGSQAKGENVWLTESEKTAIHQRVTFHLRPDFLLREIGGGRPQGSSGQSLVVDAKWKFSAPGADAPDVKEAAWRPLQQDLAQIFLYTQAYGVARGLLVYPVLGETGQQTFLWLQPTYGVRRLSPQLRLGVLRINLSLVLNGQLGRLLHEMHSHLKPWTVACPEI